MSIGFNIPILSRFQHSDKETCAPKEGNYEKYFEYHDWHIRWHAINRDNLSLGAHTSGRANYTFTFTYFAANRCLRQRGCAATWSIQTTLWQPFSGCSFTSRRVFVGRRYHTGKPGKKTCGWQIVVPGGTDLPTPQLTIGGNGLLFTPTPPAGKKVNVNTATADELDKLPGIGQTSAQKIVEYRTANGPYTRIEDLLKVPGIGPSILDEIRGSITIGP
jgi:competence ComEA-like helix-hairpin-helix protein